MGFSSRKQSLYYVTLLLTFVYSRGMPLPENFDRVALRAAEIKRLQSMGIEV